MTFQIKCCSNNEFQGDFTSHHLSSRFHRKTRNSKVFSKQKHGFWDPPNYFRKQHLCHLSGFSHNSFSNSCRNSNGVRLSFKLRPHQCVYTCIIYIGAEHAGKSGLLPFLSNKCSGETWLYMILVFACFRMFAPTPMQSSNVATSLQRNVTCVCKCKAAKV